MTLLKKLIAAAVLIPGLAFASEAGYPLDRAPDHTKDMVALQNGARLFVNYCLSCHSASSMRYNKLKDLGLSEDQIKNNLMFTSDKIGGMMTVAMSGKDAKTWFGAEPPDLSVIARAKASEAGSGPDWLYTYLRTFYKDDTRPTGWNNMVFPNVGMPHVLWELQGVRTAKFEEVKNPHEEGKLEHKFAGFEQVTPGTMTALEYDKAVADLVSFMTWMAEPARATRKQIGVWVLLFLGVCVVLTWRLNASYWKNIK
ncbi:MAG TPA: cytochrome c1 [Oxalicibacterium sp.]|jgi:ubiquinol-cytochrome c reductase cytochrome c1 subunit|nr:cytochrome c1 [Oxalicibacterium sp.]